MKHLKVLVVYWEAPFPCPPLFTAKSNTSIDCQLIDAIFDNYSIHLQAYDIGDVPTEINCVITYMGLY